MGICASCLGRSRHPSQDIDETDALLDDSQTQYGGLSGDGATEPDEEELRREREALEQITAEATENMIDVWHPETSELRQQPVHAGEQHGVYDGHTPDGHIQHSNDADEDEEDAAWLQSVQTVGAADVQGLQSGTLVMDLGMLREEPLQSAAVKSLKGRLPR